MYFYTVSSIFCVAIDDFEGGTFGDVVLFDEVYIIVPYDKTAGACCILYVEVEDSAVVSVFSCEGSFGVDASDGSGYGIFLFGL